MVVFVTLFLALTVGVQAVEVRVEGPVAEVEFFLDGELMAVAPNAPWRVFYDFGQDLRPHEIVAVARDGEGNEIGRAKQLVNYPRDKVAANIALQRDSVDVPRSARITALSGIPRKISNIEVDLDGRSIRVDRYGVVRFPRDLRNDSHVLSCVVTFTDGEQARSELTFGSFFGGETETELTAVPLATDGSVQDLTPDHLKGILTVEGVPLKINAVEQIGAKVVVIQAEESVHGLELIAAHERGYNTKGFKAQVVDPGDTEKDQLVFVLPCAKISKAQKNRSAQISLFPTYTPLDLSRARLSTMLEFLRPTRYKSCRHHVADAVASSAFATARKARPRAVVLLLGGTLSDASELSPDQARQYLESINVPLHVWCIHNIDTEGRWRKRGGPPDEAVMRWKPDRIITSHQDLVEASDDLMGRLRSQWIAWVEGDRLPTMIEIAGGGSGIGYAR